VFFPRLERSFLFLDFLPLSPPFASQSDRSGPISLNDISFIASYYVCVLLLWQQIAFSRHFLRPKGFSHILSLLRPLLSKRRVDSNAILSRFIFSSIMSSSCGRR
jgi:hypothetical protein